MARLTFEDFVIGDVYELGDRRVTKQEIVAFAEQYDPQSYHVDESAAEDSLFGELVASGWHTTAIMSAMSVQALFDEVATAGGLGVDDLRWPTPVRPGDTLSGKIEVLDTSLSESHPDRGYVDFQIELANSNDETVLSLINYQIIFRASLSD